MFRLRPQPYAGVPSLMGALRRALALPPEPPADVSHPHRVALAYRRPRRPGRVASRAQPCLSPVGRPAPARMAARSLGRAFAASRPVR